MKPLKVCGCCVTVTMVEDEARPMTNFTLGKDFVGSALSDDGSEVEPWVKGNMLVPLFAHNDEIEKLIESDYESEADLLKFKVADGKFAGYVGYAIVKEKFPNGLA